MSKLTGYLHNVGPLKDFQYIDYFFLNQDPPSGYKAAALEKIKAAPKKYHPS